jgi:SAM-dependent methyltransferase
VGGAPKFLWKKRRPVTATSAELLDGCIEQTLGLYDEHYAAKYNELYLCQRKHGSNKKVLLDIFEQLDADSSRWLDTCCGQAWHFGQFPNVQKTGVDLSAAQLSYAAAANPSATFIQSDILSVQLPEHHFDLVTNFWLAYCYLDSFENIERLVRQAVRWTRPGGYLYFDLVFAEQIPSWNTEDPRMRRDRVVFDRGDNYVKWGFRDQAGSHLMTSPPASFFTDLLAPHFDSVEILPNGVYRHLIASGKRRD